MARWAVADSLGGTCEHEESRSARGVGDDARKVAHRGEEVDEEREHCPREQMREL